MKKMKVFAVIILLICICISQKSNAQIVSDTSWTFKPTYANPQSGRPFPITNDYRIKYSSHEIDVYLPYRGEAYGGADVISGNNPLRFTSNDFTEKRTALKKGRQELLINFNDSKTVEYLRFTIYPDGNTYLQIRMINRSAMNFTGTKSSS